MPLASLTSSVTSAVATHGLWVVFALMLVDAVFPAASELVMVYAGAVATGAFVGIRLTLFGYVFGRGFAGYLAAALAGTVGYLGGALLGWLLGYYGGRPWLERRGDFSTDAGAAQACRSVVCAGRRLRGVDRESDPGRELVHL